MSIRLEEVKDVEGWGSSTKYNDDRVHISVGGSDSLGVRKTVVFSVLERFRVEVLGGKNLWEELREILKAAPESTPDIGKQIEEKIFQHLFEEFKQDFSLFMKFAEHIQKTGYEKGYKTRQAEVGEIFADLAKIPFGL